MPEYIVQRGDTLWRIARNHGIRYWPNVYFATQNNAFRQTHPNPDLIYPGDRIFIPQRSAIAPMERHPVMVHRDIPLFTQSAETCWRATGKMLYFRRHPVRTAEENFDSVIGSNYRDQETGLSHTQWHDFYCSRLGMRETQIASPNDLHYIIASHGPAIVAIGGGSSSHSMVMAGYNLYRGQWFVFDPAAGEELQFAPDVITVRRGSSASTATQEAETTEASRLTGYRTAAPTWANMGRWLWILDTTVHEKVYYY